MGIRDRSEPRDGYAVRVLAVHTSEGVDKPAVDDAAALRDASWWEGSAHAIADGDPGSLLTPAEGCVPYERAAWTLRSGNRWSENIELVAQAGWTRAQWLARPVLLENCARWLADRSKARGIPLVKLTPQQYRAGQWGVIGHNDHTVGYSDGSHWDPGPNFPWDVVLDRARQIAEGDDMPTAREVAIAVLDETRARQGGLTGPASLGGMMTWNDAKFAEVNANIKAQAEIIRTLAAARPDEAIDVDALLARIDQRIDQSIERSLAEGIDVAVTVGGQAAGPVS